MLTRGSNLLETPIISLQTGAKLAQTSKAIIDPEDLKLVAYQIEGSLLSENPSFLITSDIREVSSVGIIINSNDDFVGLNDVIKLKSLYELKFPLVGMSVVDQSHHKLGKVNDYVIDNSSFFIKQISLKSGILKSISSTSKLIDRSQIVEINNQDIVVKDSKIVEPILKPLRSDFVNPFSSSSPQSEAVSASSSRDLTISS